MNKPGDSITTYGSLPPTFTMMDQLVFQNTVDRLKGRVLTIVDASFTDPRQRKAVKDLLRKAFKETRYEGYEFFFGKAYVMNIGETEEVPEEKF